MSASRYLTRRHFLQLSGAAAAGATLSACGARAAASAPLSEGPVANADEALKRLLDGNQRYMAHKSLDLNEAESRRVEVAKGQQPFATIFSCVDSRVPPELVFDRGLGDLFVIRTAGHVIDQAVLGSLEFGVAELHIPVLVVLGHQRCGAVKATIEAVEKNAHAEADIAALVEGIRPAAEQAKGKGDELDYAVHANTVLTVGRLMQSPILSEALAAGKLRIVGAYYSLDSGRVELID